MKKDRPYDAARKLHTQLGSVELKVITREVYPLNADERGTSVGALVDELLCLSAKEGKCVQDVTVHLFDDQLETVHDYYSPNGD
jgi:hypothetical protein